ncbi:MAG: CDP-diacylglycerol--glycerol-3-phosphate 3-phosphatidyltransferase [Pseudomonadota bacterium]|nr:CDP-diacylglycerol--glycerol-3-phosphate 3-phosphatidyltransferase [Pseudomonadota bacterium]
MPLNVPIALTWLRILLIPVFVGVLYLPTHFIGSSTADLIAMLLFVLAAITDWADGYLARALNQTSAFGAFLDPVADKLMVAAALIVLVQLGRVHAVVAMIIIGREITISALREWMAQMGKSRSVAVSMIGKIKTTAQMTAIPFLLFHGALPLGLPGNGQDIGSPLLWVAALLTMVSMFYYLRMAAQVVQQGVDEGEIGR